MTLSGSHEVRDSRRGRLDAQGALILEQVVEEEGKPTRRRLPAPRPRRRQPHRRHPLRRDRPRHPRNARQRQGSCPSWSFSVTAPNGRHPSSPSSSGSRAAVAIRVRPCRSGAGRSARRPPPASRPRPLERSRQAEGRCEAAGPAKICSSVLAEGPGGPAACKYLQGPRRRVLCRGRSRPVFDRLRPGARPAPSGPRPTAVRNPPHSRPAAARHSSRNLRRASRGRPGTARARARPRIAGRWRSGRRGASPGWRRSGPRLCRGRRFAPGSGGLSRTGEFMLCSSNDQSGSLAPTNRRNRSKAAD